MMFEIRSKHRWAAVWTSLIALALMTACSSEPEPVEEQAEVAAEEPAPAQRRATRTTNAPVMEELPSPSSGNLYRFVPDVQGQLEEDGPGLVSTLDGSSAQAFKESLSWIAADTSPEQYAKLENSIRYINLYDPSVVGSDANMRQLLDGMTGEEVIRHADELERRRSVGNQ